ncbi:hypothetical protein GGQ74_001756 [Desulfobaculum xiamenense]|uniref:Uncharacterized protein n=1 Tax=Desulfobaculum xiamenense TaxID=995050 RepID=A0A846QP59_9BACT|nr:hypothetical protein [Desulfobaculum xiamenense]NJB68083.1 hypothetical protein [Desulfobaculum xiamenense]
MASTLNHAVADVAEVMKFENWLRFYFIEAEEGEALRIGIPADTLADVEQKFPHLFELAKRYDGSLIDYQRSCTEVCAHVATIYDGTKYPPGLVDKTFDTKELKLEMYLFGLWMQGHESVLDEEYMDFGEWMTAFESWKGSDEVKDYLSRLTDVGSQDAVQ